MQQTMKFKTQSMLKPPYWATYADNMGARTMAIEKDMV